MVELTQDTERSHNGIHVKLLASKCPRTIAYFLVPRGTQKQNCASSTGNGLMGRAVTDLFHVEMETGKQEGANDSERSRHPPQPWRYHLLQKESVTPTR